MKRVKNLGKPYKIWNFLWSDFVFNFLSSENLVKMNRVKNWEKPDKTWIFPWSENLVKMKRVKNSSWAYTKQVTKWNGTKKEDWQFELTFEFSVSLVSLIFLSVRILTLSICSVYWVVEKILWAASQLRNRTERSLLGLRRKSNSKTKIKRTKFDLNY